MKSLFEHLLPAGRVSNSHPLFILESARVQRLLNRQALNQLSVKFTVIPLVTLLAFWILVANSDNRRLFQFQIGVHQLILFSLIAGVALEGALDFACMVATGNSFAREFLARRWELFQLTPMLADG